MALCTSSLPSKHFLSSAPPPKFPFKSFQFPAKRLLSSSRALKEWREYEEAVKQKDLAQAFKFLKSIEQKDGDPVDEKLQDGSFPIESTRLRPRELEFVGGLERDWEVLDAFLNASDMRLMGSAYGFFLKKEGFCPILEDSTV